MTHSDTHSVSVDTSHFGRRSCWSCCCEPNAASLAWEIPAHRRKTYGGKDIVVIRGLNGIRAGAVPRDTHALINTHCNTHSDTTAIFNSMLYDLQ